MEAPNRTRTARAMIGARNGARADPGGCRRSAAAVAVERHLPQCRTVQRATEIPCGRDGERPLGPAQGVHPRGRGAGEGRLVRSAQRSDRPGRGLAASRPPRSLLRDRGPRGRGCDGSAEGDLRSAIPQSCCESACSGTIAPPPLDRMGCCDSRPRRVCPHGGIVDDEAHGGRGESSARASRGRAEVERRSRLRGRHRRRALPRRKPRRLRFTECRRAGVSEHAASGRIIGIRHRRHGRCARPILLARQPVDRVLGRSQVEEGLRRRRRANRHLRRDRSPRRQLGRRWIHRWGIHQDAVVARSGRGGQSQRDCRLFCGIA